MNECMQIIISQLLRSAPVSYHTIFLIHHHTFFYEMTLNTCSTIEVCNLVSVSGKASNAVKTSHLGVNAINFFLNRKICLCFFPSLILSLITI